MAASAVQQGRGATTHKALMMASRAIVPMKRPADRASSPGTTSRGKSVASGKNDNTTTHTTQKTSMPASKPKSGGGAK